MNNLKNHVIYYTIGLAGISSFTTLITFKEFRWITITQKDMTGGCYSLTLITAVYGWMKENWWRLHFAELSFQRWILYILSASMKELDN